MILRTLINSILLLCSILITDGNAKAAPKPNIVFILADDLGYGDPGCYGGTTIDTPNIDRLAEGGLRFTQAYSGGAVCTPARCTFLTGFHNGHNAARDNVPHYPTYLQDSDITVAEVLKTAGYRCGGVGKWSLGDAGTDGRATNQGFDKWFGYLNQDHAHYYYPEYLDDDDDRLELTGNTESRTDYSHDLLTENALSFIRESASGEKPFFLYAAYALPHFSAKDEDPDGFTVPTTDPYTNRPWDEKSKKYASMVHMLDRDIGRIHNLINELSLQEDTLIIFTSDNGGHRTLHERFDTNGPLRGYKRDLTEGGIRVPFIAHWPGKISAGNTSDTVIAFQDMLPTFAEMTGAELPENRDGISVLPVFRGEKLSGPRPPLYWDYGHCRGKQYAQAARMGDWKGIRSVKTGNQMELYDLSNDIGESKNLAKDHPDIVTKIAEFMDEAVVPNPKYEIGTIYKGSAIWKKSAK